MRKKPDSKTLREIAQLFKLAKENKNKAINARRYIARARKLAKRNNISLKNYRKIFCHKCNSYFILGKNCQIRLSKGKVSVKCLECGNHSRYIYKTEK